MTTHDMKGQEGQDVDVLMFIRLVLISNSAPKAQAMTTPPHSDDSFEKNKHF